MTTPPQESAIYDIGIIGGGVVGCAIAREAAAEFGLSVVVMEREADVLSHASGSNSGILCTGVDTAAPTERALIRDSISRFRSFYKAMNLPSRECGSLVCDFSKPDVHNEVASKSTRLEEVLAESHNAGDTNASLLDSEEVARLENDLAPTNGAVHIPGETVVDPWLSAVALAVHARQNGAVFHTSFDAGHIESPVDDDCWIIHRKQVPESCQDGQNVTQHPDLLRARVVVNATGLWADELQASVLGQAPGFTLQPRRGQYVVFEGAAGTTCPIQPIPTQFTKGVFVFTTLYDQIVVGPTALDQKSKTDRSVDDVVRTELMKYSHSVLPTLQSTALVVGDYVGLRPATEHRDYQIQLKPSQRWLTVAGVRSTGLTASLGIGRYCLSLLINTGILVPKAKHTTITRPLPDVVELAREFRAQGCEFVRIDGWCYRVTHPLTRWGWAGAKGLAAPPVRSP